MYAVVYKSSGIVAVRFVSRGNAVDWIINNGYDDEGNDLNIFEIKKV